MRLTQFSNYALRILQYAALHSPDRVRVEDVARAHGISRNHLLKAANRLSHEGFITMTRGRGGGLELARPASDIRVGAVVRVTEAPLTLVECFDAKENTCPLAGACHLSRALNRALQAFLAELDQVTIADIAANRGELLARLGDADA